MNIIDGPIQQQLHDLAKANLYKDERVITSPQHAQIYARDHKVINMCANNYLGLADDPEVIDAAHEALDRYGFGVASVRFICGTQDIHLALESALGEFLGFPAAILYSSCFDANAGLFEVLLGPQDAIISDSLNHASIIDGVRLCKAQRFRYAHNDMDALEQQLQVARGCETKMIVTDGVFSMDGTVANLPEICALAERYQALVVVDDSHAVGFMGEKGRGSHEYLDVMGRVDIMTGTFGKALGGASGGYVVASEPIVAMLRQKSRPYLFSNSLAPVIAATTLAIIKRLPEKDDLRQKLRSNTELFRQKMMAAGFHLKPGDHPIVPIMLGDAGLANQMAAELFEKGIYVIGFSYPVVPRGEARIRVQLSASHEQQDIEEAVAAFEVVGQQLGVIPTRRDDGRSYAGIGEITGETGHVVD